MENLSKNRYVKKDMTKDWLLSNGFRFNRLFSDEETEVYTYRFPVYKYESFIVLECELQVTIGENLVKINVYDYGTINKYAPFYYSEYGNYDKILEIIWTNIDKQLQRLLIDKNNEKEEMTNGSKNKNIKKRRNYSNKRK